MGICEDTSIFKESILISCRMMSESLLGNISQYPFTNTFPHFPAWGFSRLLQIRLMEARTKKACFHIHHNQSDSIGQNPPYAYVTLLFLVFPIFQSFIFNFTHSIWGFYLFSTPYQYSFVSHLLISTRHEIHSCIQHWFIILQILWRLII